jgi:hypothetical protein
VVQSDERIDRRSLLERGLLRLPEPALRMAWHMRDLYGAMKDRFGHYEVAKHYQTVERATKTAFAKLEASDTKIGQRIRTTQRFFDWVERQLDRLQPAERSGPDHSPGRDR